MISYDNGECRDFIRELSRVVFGEERVTRDELARRIRELRESRGLTQAEVAAALGLHRPAVSEIEAGRRAVTAEELSGLCRLLAVPVHVLLGDVAPTRGEVERILYRRAGEGTEAVQAAVRRFTDRCRAQREIQALLGWRPGQLRSMYPAPVPATREEAVAQGEALAEGERTRLGLGWEPLRRPLGLLERQDVCVGPLEGLEDVELDGLYFETDELGACVGLNTGRDWTAGLRTAFTAMHEYAHWLLGDIRVERYVEGRGGDPIETRANAFAAAFLMPAAGLRAWIEGLGWLLAEASDELLSIAVVRGMEHFGVSQPAFLFRLQNLGFLDVDVAERLRSANLPTVELAAALGLTLGRDEQPGAQVRVLAIEAWQRGAIDAACAAELLGEAEEEFLERTSELGVGWE